jgi:DNA-binding transcriptional LysR family regulator
MLDATRLRVLVAVARHGSVTAAAQALNYAQPSISHHMARLEAETGAKLMERSGRGIRLTEAGRLLAERAEEILGRLDAAEAELAAHVGLRRERVRLAACGPALATLAAAAAAALLAEHAGLDIQLTEAEAAKALRMLRAGDVDLAVVCQFRHDAGLAEPEEPASTDPGADSDLHWRLLLDEPVYLITSATRGDTGAVTRLTDCAGQRWVATGDQQQDFLIRLCRPAGFMPEWPPGLAWRSCPAWRYAPPATRTSSRPR